jgi:hypothetical protein
MEEGGCFVCGFCFYCPSACGVGSSRFPNVPANRCVLPVNSAFSSDNSVASWRAPLCSDLSRDSCMPSN